MEVEFLTADTNLRPVCPCRGHAGAAGEQYRQGHVCQAAGRCSHSGRGGRQRDFICPFPLAELAVALRRSAQTCKRTLRELEAAGLILRVRREIGAPNRIYVLVPQKQD